MNVCEIQDIPPFVSEKEHISVTRAFSSRFVNFSILTLQKTTLLL